MLLSRFLAYGKKHTSFSNSYCSNNGKSYEQQQYFQTDCRVLGIRSLLCRTDESMSH